jgi:hypothetical protein
LLIFRELYSVFASTRGGYGSTFGGTLVREWMPSVARRWWICGSVEGSVGVSYFMYSVMFYVVFKALIIRESGRCLLASTKNIIASTFLH